jgi:hypothetical protein
MGRIVRLCELIRKMLWKGNVCPLPTAFCVLSYCGVMRSKPSRYGRNAAGTMTEPSACW